MQLGQSQQRDQALESDVVQNRWPPFNYLVDRFRDSLIGCVIGHLASNGRKVKPGVRSGFIVSVDEELRPQCT